MAAIAAETYLNWINEQQTEQEIAKWGRNRRAIEEALDIQRVKHKQINNYKTEISKANIKDEEKENVDRSYRNLQVIAGKRQGCLETMTKLVQLEDLFAGISQEFSDKATGLVREDCQPIPLQPGEYDGSIANSSQSCILAVRDTWAWTGKLLRCAELHLQHAADYHQFFQQVSEYEHWMPVELEKAEKMLLNHRNLKRNAQGEDTSKLLLEMKTALTVFLHWRGKVDSLFDKARTISPVYLRTRRLDHPRPVYALAAYKTSQINIQEGEEVTLISNERRNLWKVRNLRGQEADVPSTILHIPGPDPSAVDAALRCNLKFLATWTNMIKQVGCTLILFLLEVIREWSSDEEKMLRALSDSDKKDILNLFVSIEKTFSPFWDKYPPFQLLKERMNKTREILAMKPDPDFKGGDNGKLLVIQTALLEELLSRFRDYWDNWEKYKILIERSRHPEYLLLTKDWQDLQYISTEEWLKRWSKTISLDEIDWKELGRGSGMDSTDWTDMSQVSVTGSTQSTSDRYTDRRTKETAESSSIATSEQEERQTFVITGVIDPRTDEEISLDKAIALKIIIQAEGRYVNPDTGEAMPIPTAMAAGKIKVEYTTVKKSAEKKRNIDLITIKTYKESRPYTIQGVIDAATDKRMSMVDAVRAGIIDQGRGIYRNTVTGEELSLADALDSGLLAVDFDADDALKGREPEIETKTYAVNGVYDLKNKKKLSYPEAVAAGIVNQETGSYYNNITDENEYIGEAIKRGHIKATVIRDPKHLDVDMDKMVTMTDASMLNNFRAKLLSPLMAVKAMRSSLSPETAPRNGSTSNGFNDGK